MQLGNFDDAVGDGAAVHVEFLTVPGSAVTAPENNGLPPIGHPALIRRIWGRDHGRRPVKRLPRSTSPGHLVSGLVCATNCADEGTKRGPDRQPRPGSKSRPRPPTPAAGGARYSLHHRRHRRRHSLQCLSRRRRARRLSRRRSRRRRRTRRRRRDRRHPGPAAGWSAIATTTGTVRATTATPAAPRRRSASPASLGR